MLAVSYGVSLPSPRLLEKISGTIISTAVFFRTIGGPRALWWDTTPCDQVHVQKGAIDAVNRKHGW
jgi:hypothetical protein